MDSSTMDIQVSFTTGDTIGAGINYATKQFFFTLNGAMVGLFNKYLKGPLFPTVSVHSHYEEVSVNFGQNKFIFDLKAYEAEEIFIIDEKIDENISIPQNACHDIVRSYLQHCGYGETFKQLDKTVKSTMSLLSEVPEDDVNEEDIMYALNHRTTLHQLIKSGKIDETFSKLGEWYPQIIEDDSSAICFMLHCQKFIELVRDRKLDSCF